MSINEKKNRGFSKDGKPARESRRFWPKFLYIYVFYAAGVLGIGAKLGLFRGLQSTTTVGRQGSNSSVTNALIRPFSLREGILAFDEEIKKTAVHEGDAEAHFLFKLSNVSKEPVTIERVETSCGCTVAQLPRVPWIMKPGDAGEFGVTMDVRGDTGENTKFLTLFTSRGSKKLTVQSIILSAAKHGNAQASNISKPVVSK